MQQSGYPTVTTCNMTIRYMLRASRTGVNPVRYCSGLRELNPTWELNPGPQVGSHHYCWTTKPTNEKFVRKRVICGSWVVLHVEGYSMCGGLLDRGVNWRGTVRWKVKLRGATASWAAGVASSPEIFKLESRIQKNRLKRDLCLKPRHVHQNGKHDRPEAPPKPFWMQFFRTWAAKRRTNQYFPAGQIKPKL